MITVFFSLNGMALCLCNAVTISTESICNLHTLFFSIKTFGDYTSYMFIYSLFDWCKFYLPSNSIGTLLFIITIKYGPFITLCGASCYIFLCSELVELKCYKKGF